MTLNVSQQHRGIEPSIITFSVSLFFRLAFIEPRHVDTLLLKFDFQFLLCLIFPVIIARRLLLHRLRDWHDYSTYNAHLELDPVKRRWRRRVFAGFIVWKDVWVVGGIFLMNFIWWFFSKLIFNKKKLNFCLDMLIFSNSNKLFIDKRSNLLANFRSLTFNMRKN